MREAMRTRVCSDSWGTPRSSGYWSLPRRKVASDFDSSTACWCRKKSAAYSVAARASPSCRDWMSGTSTEWNTWSSSSESSAAENASAVSRRPAQRRSMGSCCRETEELTQYCWRQRSEYSSATAATSCSTSSVCWRAKVRTSCRERRRWRAMRARLPAAPASSKKRKREARRGQAAAPSCSGTKNTAQPGSSASFSTIVATSAMYSSTSTAAATSSGAAAA
mmetsp:Transcript_9195/g.37869  ORF Transcript_9195/g.37869 Transcript_9195/m.37869 type:complete len:222 (+) Transcript_9195:854-1519(+)